MTWIKIDDQFPDHRKTIEVGPHAAWLHVCALCYCNRQQTDGWFPKRIVPRLADVPKPLQLAQRLVEVGLWAEHDERFEIHHYLDWQRSDEQIENERKGSRERQRKYRGSNAVTNGEVLLQETEVETEVDSNPPTPLEKGGQRANGTNPRAKAAKERAKRRAQPRVIPLADGSTYEAHAPPFQVAGGGP